MTAANGLRNRFRESFSAVGTDVLYVSRMPWVVMNDFFLLPQPPPHRPPGSPGAGAASCAARPSSTPSIDGRRDVKYRAETMERRERHRHHGQAGRACPAPSPQTGRFLMPFDVLYKKKRLRDRHRCPGRAVRDRGPGQQGDPDRPHGVPGHRRDGEAGRQLPRRTELRPAGLRPDHVLREGVRRGPRPAGRERRGQGARPRRRWRTSSTR